MASISIGSWKRRSIKVPGTLAGPDPLRLLVTGASGQVGGELLHTLAPLGVVIAPSRSEMNLADRSSICSFIRETKPHWIVNAGAYTAVDKAESEPEAAYAINAEGAATIGSAAHSVGATVLHFSTDYVFDGRRPAPYLESDPTGPLGVYGASKLAGEQALLESGAEALVFRTSWVYGATGKNFLRTILKLAREREELRIVADQHGSPTWSRDLARMAGARDHPVRANDPAAQRTLSGIYHATGHGETTWAGFATEAVAQLQQREARDNRSPRSLASPPPSIRRQLAARKTPA